MSKVEKAIELCKESLAISEHDADGTNPEYEQEQVFLYKTALQALQEKLDREKPQSLSLEQLRWMDKTPVWYEGVVWQEYVLISCGKRSVSMVDSIGNTYPILQEKLDAGNKFYTHKPEQEG